MGAGRGIIKPNITDMNAKKQVLSAVGQVSLMSAYAEVFAKHKQICAQVLATKEDFRDKTHYFNMRTCFENLLASNVVPIVNENDVVATTELLFTDNDELAGLVAAQINAEAVIILTGVDGFLSTDAKTGKTKVVPEINHQDITKYQAHILSDKTEFGRGGMLTKFSVAKKLTLQGIAVHIASGERADILLDLCKQKSVGTKFIPHAKSSALKRRIAYSEGLTRGSVRVNKRAADLLLKRDRAMSLLPVGVVAVAGDFKKGDVIEIVGENKEKIGFGIAEYGADKAAELIGRQKARPIIHYNHMFINS